MGAATENLERLEARRRGFCFLAVDEGGKKPRPARVLIPEDEFRKQLEDGFFEGRKVAVRFLDRPFEDHTRMLPEIDAKQIQIVGSKSNVACATGQFEDSILDSLLAKMAET